MADDGLDGGTPSQLAFDLRRNPPLLIDGEVAGLASMRSAGASFLNIPENYYDDVESKYASHACNSRSVSVRVGSRGGGSPSSIPQLAHR
jgi:hypothetical protein